MRKKLLYVTQNLTIYTWLKLNCQHELIIFIEANILISAIILFACATLTYLIFLPHTVLRQAP